MNPRSSKQLEVMPSSFAKKGADDPTCCLLNHHLAFERWVISERCRIVGLLGIGGIGKSTIAVKAALQMQSEFEVVVWRSLSNAPPLDELLSSLLKFLMPLYGEDPIIPTTLAQQISKLMQYLRSRRCLVILDNAETILQREQVGQWRSGYDEYGQLLRAIGEASHQSCLLLTSREKPREMALMEGAQALVRSLSLSGLSPDDGRAIFRQKGAFTGSEAEWHSLGTSFDRRYSRERS